MVNMNRFLRKAIEIFKEIIYSDLWKYEKDGKHYCSYCYTELQDWSGAHNYIDKHSKGCVIGKVLKFLRRVGTL